MKKNKLTMAVAAGIAGVAGMANAAQYINPEGHGEVLIYPYYSVNNDLNTLYSIVNTTADTKGVKVRFLEGENSREVLDFNVYLSAYDVWTGALVPSTSTIPGHAGELSGTHISGDQSCAPFLNKAGQEFLPYEIDNDAPNNNMLRSRDGHIEVLEMATFIGATAGAADHGATGIPASCATIAGFWGVGDLWTGDAEQLPTGGIFGSASIVNVGQGLSMTYDAIAIGDFWFAAGSHTAPGSLFPNLSNGDSAATVFDNGVAVTSNWINPIEATSSLFMKQAIYNEYAFDSFINGKSEWVVTFPTKHQHVNGVVVLPPFQELWNGTRSCDDYSLTTWDREEQENAPGDGVISPRPPDGVAPSLCYEANVVEFISASGVAGAASSIMGADNLVTVSGVTVAHATENGWARIDFTSPAHTMTSADPVTYSGLPVVGFSAQAFTNAGAADGLLAQYAGLFVHKGLVVSL